MSTGITDFGARQWAAMLVGAVPVPTGYWVALLTDEVGPAADGDVLADLEPPAGSGYARQFLTTGAGHWDSADDYLTNLDTVDFGSPSEDWGLITHYALCSAADAGEVYAWGEFLNPADAPAGTPDVAVPPGGIVVALYALDPTIAV